MRTLVVVVVVVFLWTFGSIHQAGTVRESMVVVNHRSITRFSYRWRKNKGLIDLLSSCMNK